ncbi:MAG: TraR/DksA C4-type zinc finger protein [Deltaproteobacteria bacterium]|nr:TraR/DksA C4-type zinc finger protein [Deltaproteobacteria bacterium]
MELSDLPRDLQETVKFHGHLCPGLLIGYRTAKAALARLGAGRSEDEELAVVAENNSCSVDAMQVLLGATFGKGNLKWRDYGKQVFFIYDRKREQALRVSFVGDHLRTDGPDGQPDREGFSRALLAAPDEELFKFREVDFFPPPEAVIEPGIVCDACGERTQESRLVVRSGRSLCRSCAAREGVS